MVHFGTVLWCAKLVLMKAGLACKPSHLCWFHLCTSHWEIFEDNRSEWLGETMAVLVQDGCQQPKVNPILTVFNVHFWKAERQWGKATSSRVTKLYVSRVSKPSLSTSSIWLFGSVLYGWDDVMPFSTTVRGKETYITIFRKILRNHLSGFL